MVSLNEAKIFGFARRIIIETRERVGLLKTRMGTVDMMTTTKAAIVAAAGASEGRAHGCDDG